MTAAERRFYAYAKSIVDVDDPCDVICIFKNKNWELVGSYTNTYYVMYYDDNYKENNIYDSWEFFNLDEALDFVMPHAGMSLRDALRQTGFDFVMVPISEAELRLDY